MITVGPRDVETRRIYRVSAIAFALALWAIALVTPDEVRRRVSPWQKRGPSAAGRWRTLGRWVDAVVRSQLFSFARVEPLRSRREQAKRIAASIASQSSRPCFGMPSAAVVFEAAAQLRSGARIG